MAYPDKHSADPEIVTVPDVDRSDGVDDPDDQGSEDNTPATSLGAEVLWDYDQPVVPGEIRTDRLGNVVIGAVAARAASDVHLPQ